LLTSAGRMPKRSQHRVSEGQDARSERPAMGGGPPPDLRAGGVPRLTPGAFMGLGNILVEVPTPQELALLTSAGRMPKRSQHRVSEGQDARSERPAMGRGHPRPARRRSPPAYAGGFYGTWEHFGGGAHAPGAGVADQRRQDAEAQSASSERRAGCPERTSGDGAWAPPTCEKGNFLWSRGYNPLHASSVLKVRFRNHRESRRCDCQTRGS
jgi:hypothetical protein